MAKKDFQVSKKFTLNGYSNFEFLVIVGETEKNNVLGGGFEDGVHGVGGFISSSDGLPYPVVAFKGKGDMIPGVIAHECLHAAWSFLDYLGIKSSADNQESLAYLVQYMVDCVTEVKKGLK